MQLNVPFADSHINSLRSANNKLQQRNAELEKSNNPQVMDEILNRLDALEKKNVELEKKNAELEEKVYGYRDSFTAMLSRIVSLENVNVDLNNSNTLLWEELATGSDSLCKIQQSFNSLKDDVNDGFDDLDNRLTSLTKLNKSDSLNENDEYESDDDDNPDTNNDDNPDTNTSHIVSTSTLEEKEEYSLANTPNNNYFCEDNQEQEAIISSIETFQKEQYKPKSCLLNYCTQCKTKLSKECKKSKGNYFCTSICVKEYQKQNSKTKGNFTSVMNSAIYN